MKGKVKMSKEKDAFMKIVQTEIFDRPDIWCENYEEGEVFINACKYWEKLKNGGSDTEKPAFTEKGIVILKYLKENPEAVLPAKKIAEDLELSSRTVSGAMKKLVNDGYVEKFEGEPKTYSITEKGKEVDFAE